ncbi:membrane-anchored mycosin MycP3 domain protein, partial [Mycobacterium ulcerans str. Harvey]
CGWTAVEVHMAGPWVGIAAPGENIVSVSNADGGVWPTACPTSASN